LVPEVAFPVVFAVVLGEEWVVLRGEDHPFLPVMPVKIRVGVLEV
jgi:hypothetical protein